MKTDKKIQQDIIDELEWEASINATEIGVSVKNGVATLSGYVNSYAEKLNAESAAQRVSGVKALIIELGVKLPGVSQRQDADIALAARNTLHWMNQLSEDAIHIMVEHGWVTLSGEVQWEYQRQMAANNIRNLTGVMGVSNRITLKPHISLQTIKKDIEAALQRRAHIDATKIAVEIKGSDIILSGTVSSWEERDLAKHAAWSAPGVHNVIDKMSIN